VRRETGGRGEPESRKVDLSYWTGREGTGCKRGLVSRTQVSQEVREKKKKFFFSVNEGSFSRKEECRISTKKAFRGKLRHR